MEKAQESLDGGDDEEDDDPFSQKNTFNLHGNIYFRKYKSVSIFS